MVWQTKSDVEVWIREKEISGFEIPKSQYHTSSSKDSQDCWLDKVVQVDKMILIDQVRSGAIEFTITLGGQAANLEILTIRLNQHSWAWQ